MVLQKNSEKVFRTVLRQQAVSQGNNSRQNPLVLDEEKPEVFLTMLDYMYTNCCTLTFELAPELLTTSIEYGLDGLRRIASRYMADSMSTDNVCIIFQSAVVNMQKELQKRAMTFIEENTEKVFYCDGFSDLSDVAIAAILRSDLLQLDELELINSLRKWAKTNSIASGLSVEKIAEPVIHTIRLALLSQTELAEVESENDSSPFIPVDMLAAAWKLHALKSPDRSNNNLRLRRGTTERDHHKFIALAANKTSTDSDDENSDEKSGSDDENIEKSDQSKSSVSEEAKPVKPEKSKKSKKKKQKSEKLANDSA